MNLILALIFVSLVSGCKACLTRLNHRTQESTAQKAREEKSSSWTISIEKIFTAADYFSYYAEMTVTTKNAGPVTDKYEKIDVIGEKPRVLLRKKVDSQHVTEILLDGSTVYVKNNGNFRRAADDAPVYQRQVVEALNLLEFFVLHFELEDRITEIHREGQQKTFAITRAFVDDIGQPERKDGNNSDITGSFSVDKKTSLPLSGNFAANITTEQGQRLAIQSSFSLELKNHGESIEPAHVQ